MNEYHYQRRWGFLWGFMSGGCFIAGILIHPSLIAFTVLSALACYLLKDEYLKG